MAVLIQGKKRMLLTAWMVGSMWSCVCVDAQTGTVAEDAVDSVWTHALVAGLSLNQVALKDWTGGGEDALAWTISVDGESAYARGKIRSSTEYRFAFGQTKLGSGGIRKTDDKIDLSSTFTYLLGSYVNPYVAATLKTQFARGYDYTQTGKIPLSQFFDPAYLTQTAGVGYQPYRTLKTRAGLGVREIVTRDFTAFTDDPGTAKVEKTLVDAGVESVTDGQWQMADNILFSTRLEIFAPLSKLDETAIRSDSSVDLQVNRYITTHVNVQVVDDDSASPYTQVKEALAVGLTYRFL